MVKYMSDLFENFYERLVIERLNEELQKQDREVTEDYFSDVACIALNHLTPRYIRYHIDAAFYITSTERQQMEQSVEKAVKDAIIFIENRMQQSPDGSASNSPT